MPILLFRHSLVQLWEGMSDEERSGARRLLPRRCDAACWALDPDAEPIRYDGPPGIPPEYQCRVVVGYVARTPDYLDAMREAENAVLRQKQNKYLRRADIGAFVEGAEVASEALRAMCDGDFDTPGEWGRLYQAAFWTLACLERAGDIAPLPAWPPHALGHRRALAGAAGRLLASVGGVTTDAPHDADLAAFRAAVEQLRASVGTTANTNDARDSPPTAMDRARNASHVHDEKQPEANTNERPPALRYVTLDRAAAMVNRKKKTLERRVNRKVNPMPAPDIEGGGGKPHEWLWSRIRPWLEQEFGRKLPPDFPALR